MTDGKTPNSLITGGAGFLGSHLCERLLSEGHTVICMDNLLTGADENIKHLISNPRFSIIHHDVTHPINLAELLKSAGHPNPELRLDYLLHFASPASPKDYARHPIHTLKVGAFGTYYALGLARAHKSRFLLASSSEVYGDPEVNPQPETYYGHVNPVGPRSVYDEAKRFAEALSCAYLHTHNLDIRIARLFNTYGPRMRINDGRAVPAFMTQAIRNQPVTVYGDGSQTRSLTYVDDTVNGLYRLLTVDRHQGNELICNIGNPEEVTILKVAEEIIALTGSTSQIVFSPLPKDDPLVRRPDLTRTKALLGWEPKIPRKEGLARVVPYFREKVGKVPV